MKPLSLTVGPFETECHLIGASEVLVIDPGGDAAAIDTALRSRNATVAAYLLTHGHVDHLDALAALAAARPAPVYMHADDAVWAFTAANRIPPFFSSAPPPPALLETVADGRKLSLGGFEIEVIGTPGHSPGSVCYHIPALRILFSGDTLFDGSAGRTDLAGGDGARLRESLRRLANLPPETGVYPGHGPATNIAEQLRVNPFMQGMTPARARRPDGSA